MYDRNSNSKLVNEARQQLFGRKGGRFESLPPTQDALIQHVKRAAFQSEYCWYKSLETQQNLPNFADWGWIKTSETNKRQPLWLQLGAN